MNVSTEACLRKRRVGHSSIFAEKVVSTKGKIVVESVRRDEVYGAQLGREDEMI